MSSLPSLKPTRAARTFSVGITMLLMMSSAIRMTTIVAMTIATMIEMIAMVEIMLCRSIMLACSVWSFCARASPEEAACAKTGVQLLTIKLAARCWSVRATWPISSASASQFSTSLTKLFSSVLSSRG